MIRLIAPFVGLFFTLSVLAAFVVGAYTQITDPPAATVEHEFHKEPKKISLSSDGPLGKFDRQQLQRGYQVYKEVCSACHSIKYVAFRDLHDLGYDEDQVKNEAATYQVPVVDANSEVTKRPGLPTDHFPPVVYGGQGTPPDLSLMAKARHGGASYIYSLLTGYQGQPKKLLEEFPDAKTPDGLHYNPYFANLNLAMPQPLMDGQVTFADGSPNDLKSEAKDVAAFLVWTAEPTLEKRNQTGWWFLGFLLFATVLGYLAYRNVWAGVKH